MHWHRSFAAFFFLSFFGTSQLVFADVVDKKTFGDMANAYLSHSLINKYRQILKPDVKRAILFWPSCISEKREKCTKAAVERKLQVSIIRNENLNLEFSKQNPEMQVIFADQQIVQTQKIEFNKKYASSFRDSDDDDCALYYELSNSIISNIVILVSLDASDLKQKVCLANQFLQGIGLSLADQKSFSELWSAKLEPFSELSEVEFDRLVHAASIYTYVHMCHEIQAGMTQETVVAILRRDACWRGIILKN